MWTQIVGKIALATTPLVNHHWNVAFHYTARGLATQPLDCGPVTINAVFDLVSHVLILRAGTGVVETIRLEPKTVAEFYAEVMHALKRLGAEVTIWTMPVEVADPIRFEEDTTHRSYDPVCAGACWRALDSMRPVFEEFRARFVGKCSPLHFFWGSFDLALTRFSGRRAPERPDANAVMREAYSHEVISHGFWPGTGAVDASFYAYVAPEPNGFSCAAVAPAKAAYSNELKEFLLPYEVVRSAKSPERELMSFLESTYEHGARLAGWDRAALER